MQGTMLLDGRYEIGGLLGRGGMADVWDGWDHVSGLPVAVKMLHPQFADRDDIVRRFYAEASAAAAIGHPNIVGVYASGEQNGTPFIVMERLTGGTLADEIGRGPIPQERVRAILDQILAALTATHARGILHRDIKPGNLLTAGDGYKLADFGLAKTKVATQTVVGEVFGTFAYLSPQRLTGVQASVDDDLFALGVIGYEALAGHHPYGPTEDLAAITHAILLRDAPPLRFFAPDADPALINAIERSMARDPAARFASAADMRAALHGQAVPVV
ncbi:serine/threonine-protein kinase, partial [Micrococcus luteus]|uniref:serine/threonine-protein kinase n=1 Tax=Micrococcus luteus TaxID=1270 RepID=UPI0034143E39